MLLGEPLGKSIACPGARLYMRCDSAMTETVVHGLLGISVSSVSGHSQLSQPCLQMSVETLFPLLFLVSRIVCVQMLTQEKDVVGGMLTTNKLPNKIRT